MKTLSVAVAALAVVLLAVLFLHAARFGTASLAPVHQSEQESDKNKLGKKLHDRFRKYFLGIRRIFDD